jgi:integrase
MRRRTKSISAAYRVLAGRPGTVVDAADRAQRTVLHYAAIVERFQAWLAARGESLPVSSATLCAWLKELATAGLKPTTIRSYATAVVIAHKLRGAPIEWRELTTTLKRVARLNYREPRVARPILRDELKAIVDLLMSSQRAIDRRDAALLTIGWAAKLRQAEIVGLDWQRHGGGRGYVRPQPGGLLVVLVSSKGKQTKPVQLVIGEDFMPAANSTLTTWAKCAELKPCQPIFTSIDHQNRISDKRLHLQEVCRIVKARVRAACLARGGAADEGGELARTASGHSLRVGGITAEALAGVPEHEIRKRSRHGSAEMVAKYVRIAEMHNAAASLRQVGF